MTKALFARILSLCLVFALITAVALTMVSCDKEDGVTAESTTESVAASTVTDTHAPTEEAIGAFTLTVTFADGTEKTEVYSFTEEGNLGDYLLEKGVVQGEDGAYGLYIKTVLGETHDYDADQSYWSFYIDGEMAMAGVSDTELTDGASYALKAEK